MNHNQANIPTKRTKHPNPGTNSSLHKSVWNTKANQFKPGASSLTNFPPLPCIPVPTKDNSSSKLLLPLPSPSTENSMSHQDELSKSDEKPTIVYKVSSVNISKIPDHDIESTEPDNYICLSFPIEQKPRYMNIYLDKNGTQILYGPTSTLRNIKSTNQKTEYSDSDKFLSLPALFHHHDLRGNLYKPDKIEKKLESSTSNYQSYLRDGDRTRIEECKHQIRTLVFYNESYAQDISHKGCWESQITSNNQAIDEYFKEIDNICEDARHRNNS